MSQFSHLDAEGAARMVDVGHKPEQKRIAVAAGRLVCERSTIALLKSQALPKGDALTVARIAGIQAAKATASLIPLCHTLPLDQVTVDFEIGDDKIQITAAARTSAKTGVEMEALTAVSVTALTLFDMMKAVDTSMRIECIRVTGKTKK